MLPSNTSSIDGCSAAVTETESPSQLSPAVNQRICTSLTPDGADLESEAMPSTPLDQYFFDVLPLQIYRHKKYGEFGTHSGREMPFSGNERPHSGNVRLAPALRAYRCFFVSFATQVSLGAHSPPFKGGVAAQRPGWLVKGRVASLYARVALLILFDITNHPVCAAKERDLFIDGAATPP